MDNLFKQHITSPVINVLGQWKEQKCFSKAPILIGGCARSGTSLLLSILSAYPGIFCFPKETDAFTQWGMRNGKAIPTRIDRMYRELLLASVPRGTYRWCEKRPYNIRFIKEILHYFGSEVRIIHVVRDPRAVCTSIHPEKPGKYWVSPDRYVQDVKAGLGYKNHPQVFMVRYEDLINDYKTTISQLCTFLNEEVHEYLQNWYDHATVRSNRAWFTKLQDLQTDPLEKWKAPEHAKRVAKIRKNQELIKLMEELGYG